MQRAIMILKNSKLLFAFVLLLTFSALGVTQEVQDRIFLEADQVNYNYKAQIVDYKGKVQATQGDTSLQADHMIVYYDTKHKIKKIVAMGELAEYKTLVGEKKNTLVAAAQTIYYYPLIGKVILAQKARVDYNKSQFSGPYIYYDMIKKIVSSHPNKNSRSKIILEPIKQLKTY